MLLVGSGNKSAIESRDTRISLQDSNQNTQISILLTTVHAL